MWKSVEISPKGPKSGRGAKIVGILDVGDDVGGLPQRVGGDRPQADGPVAFAGAWHADDVEFDAPAERMPLQRVVDPRLDLLESGRSFCKKRIELHLAPPQRPKARPWWRTVLSDYCWGEFG